MTDHRQGIEHDYARRSGIVSSHLLLPTAVGQPLQLDHVRQSGGHVGLPPEAHERIRGERERLWNAAELAEKRKDARTAREWIIALPAELPAAQRQALAVEFGRDLVQRYGVAVDVAIHLPDRQGDQRNHHAHVLTTTRTVVHDPGTGVLELGPKSTMELSDTDRRKRDLGPARDEVSRIREAWAGMVNRALERAGEVSRVDHRSLAVQQAEALAAGDTDRAARLERIPQLHLGPVPTSDLRQARRRGAEPNTDRARQYVETERQNSVLAELQQRLGQAWKVVREQAAAGVAALKAGYQQIAESLRSGLGFPVAAAAAAGPAPVPSAASSSRTAEAPEKPHELLPAQDERTQAVDAYERWKSGSGASEQQRQFEKWKTEQEQKQKAEQDRAAALKQEQDRDRDRGFGR